MTTAFYSRPITTNYCHYKSKIKVSHSEKSTTRRSQNTSYLPYNLDLNNNYPQQYPITHKNSPNYPITRNYPKLPISLTNINSSRNTTRYPENNPPCSGNNANCLTTTNYLYNTYFYSKFTFARHNTRWYKTVL